jgi:hypothetical protein
MKAKKTKRTHPTGKELAFLKAPKLLSHLTKEIQLDVMGEKSAIRALIMCMSGRLVKNSAPVSYNVLLFGESGVGKDYIAVNVLKIFPVEQIAQRSRISVKTLTYWHNHKKEPNWTWDGIVMYLEDAANAVLNSEVLKVMLSNNGTTSTIVVKNQAIDFEVVGKPVCIFTSANAKLIKEQERRMSILHIYKTPEEINAINTQKYYKAQHTRNTKSSKSNLILIRKCLSYLKEVTVSIPFADNIRKYIIIPSNMMSMTVTERFLDLIKASASLHQFNRTLRKGVIAATAQDYKIARLAMIRLIPKDNIYYINEQQRDIVDTLKKEVTGKNKDGLTQIRIYSILNPQYKDRQLAKYLEDLFEKGYIEKQTKDKFQTYRSEGHRTLYYKISKTHTNRVIIPKWKELNIK